MTQAEISNFLQAGALLGGADGQCFLSMGPWRAADGSSEGWQVAVQPFFESRMTAYSSSVQPRLLSREDLKIALTDFLTSNKASERYLRAEDFTLPTLSDYRVAFDDIQQRIDAGILAKGVPVVFARKDFRAGEGISLWQRAKWLLNLLNLPLERLFVYGYWSETTGILGATPEVLFSKNKSRLRTMALAGTLPKSEVTHRRPLSEDPKEIHEHQLVVDDIAGQLQGLGELRVGPLETIELPTLFHLKTQIDLSLDSDSQMDVSQLTALLHPTPALGVSPRSAGYTWLASHPGQQDRGLFGGPILFRLSPEKIMALVAIRNIEWNSQGIKVGTGGGVVAASQLEREWLELQQKREAVFKSLGM